MAATEKTRWVSSIRTGEKVSDVFVLAEKTLSTKKNGEPYLKVTLSDKTGSAKGVMWNRVDSVKASSGDHVFVTAAASEYRGELQLVIEHMQPADMDSLNPMDFLPVSERDTDAMLRRLVEIMEKIGDPHLRELLQAFFRDESFAEKFKHCPAAKHMHHAYIGGLLEHSLSMAILVERIAGHYAGVDMELLLAGAILHDIGKIEELSYSASIEYSDKGRLLGHITMGCIMITERIRTIPDFPEEKAQRLLHMIISHHGDREFGSPEIPMTIEAVLLNYIDEIDARVNGIREFIRQAEPLESWTGYHHLLQRRFYKKPGEKNTIPQTQTQIDESGFQTDET